MTTVKVTAVTWHWLVTLKGYVHWLGRRSLPISSFSGVLLLYNYNVLVKSVCTWWTCLSRGLVTCGWRRRARCAWRGRWRRRRPSASPWTCATPSAAPPAAGTTGPARGWTRRTDGHIFILHKLTWRNSKNTIFDINILTGNLYLMEYNY